MQKGDLVRVRPWTDAEVESLLKKLYYSKKHHYGQADEKRFRKNIKDYWRKTLAAGEYMTYMGPAKMDLGNSSLWGVKLDGLAALSNGTNKARYLYPSHLLEIVFSV